ncbi:hypothetical protein [Acholeplasma palmae]|uniref:hypothetical protein n=1 Tax=Acholeplasma palmae TaxID=38986 RepID=UPI0005FA9500|nr:hypothetical protein [Alteracholeplasma palmae]
MKSSRGVKLFLIIYITILDLIMAGFMIYYLINKNWILGGLYASTTLIIAGNIIVTICDYINKKD